VTEKGFRERAQETARTGREPQWQKKSRVLRKGLQGQGKGTLHSDRNLPLTGQRLAHRDEKIGSSRGRSVSRKRQRKRIPERQKERCNGTTWVTPEVLQLPAKGAENAGDGQALRRGNLVAESLPVAEENPWSTARRIPGEYFEVSGRRKEPYKDAGKAHSF